MIYPRSPLLWLFLLQAPVLASGQALNCPSVFQNEPFLAQFQPSLEKGRLPVGLDLNLFPESTASRVFIEMAKQGMLLSQISPNLADLDLLKPNGGLCASTCVTNLLGAISAQYHNYLLFPQRAPHITHSIVDAYSQMTGQDARFGANVNTMSDLILGLYPTLLDQLVYDSFYTRLDLQLKSFDKEIYAHSIFQAMRHDTIAIASVKAHDPISFGSSSGHAIILLKVDTQKHHLYISDPNLPNEILRIPYRFKKGTDIIFNVPFTFGDHPVEIYQINIFRRLLTDHK